MLFLTDSSCFDQPTLRALMVQTQVDIVSGHLQVKLWTGEGPPA